ncbi:MAG: hypothetical protein ABIA04_14760 [Pseudomonadota bacterium]
MTKKNCSVFFILTILILFSFNIYAKDQGWHLSYYNDDLPQLSEEDLEKYKGATEWWYFDIQKEDFSLVVIYVRQNPLVYKDASSYIHIEYEKNGEVVKKVRETREMIIKTYEPVSTDNKLVQDRALTRFYMDEKNEFSMLAKSSDPELIDEYQLSFDVAGISGKLNFKPIHQGFYVNDDGCYFHHKENPELKSCANFAAPRMKGWGWVVYKKEAEGSGCNPAYTYEHTDIYESEPGEGYHDHPWNTDHFIATYHEWHWGRLFAEDVSVMYANVIPQDEYNGILNFAYYTKKGEYKPYVDLDIEIIPEEKPWEKETDSFLNVAFPHNLKLISKDLGFEIRTQFQSLLADDPMYNRSNVKFIFWETNDDFNAEGTGWTEYVTIPTENQWLISNLNWLKYLGRRF